MTKFAGWDAVAQRLEVLAKDKGYLNKGQRASVMSLSSRLPSHGVILADEVGMGKTRIAVTLAKAVRDCGGRTSIVVPPGLANQWIRELQLGAATPEAAPIQSIWQFLSAFSDGPTYNRPWSGNSIQLISQGFANWQNRHVSQRLLLPVIESLWIKENEGRHRGGSKAYHPDHIEGLSDRWCAHAVQAARSIYAYSSYKSLSNLMHEKDGHDWRDAEAFAKHEPARVSLHRAIGLGLGDFDLTIIDEAHKNRGSDGNLSLLLQEILTEKRASRRLAVTATPVELDLSQWRQSFERIGIAPSHIEKVLMPSIEAYREATDEVRLHWRTSEKSRLRYAQASSRFQEELRPFLLRRDKREDESVQKFANISSDRTIDYRNVEPLNIKLESLSALWKQVVVAAEALSCLRGPRQSVKRLRLTVGNGHGVSSTISRLDASELDATQLFEDGEYLASNDGDGSVGGLAEAGDLKSLARERFWIGKISQATKCDRHAIIDHPAIVNVADEIERLDRTEKVLVFGRFVQPMLALATRLNALALIRIVSEDGYWPRAKLTDEERQVLPLVGQKPEQIAKIEMAIAKGMLQFEKRRDAIGRRLDNEQFRAKFAGVCPKLAPILGAALQSDDPKGRALLARAVAESLPKSDNDLEGSLIDALEKVLLPLANLDEDPLAEKGADVGAVEAGEYISAETHDLWDNIHQELAEEYGSGENSTPRSAYARVMRGATSMQTRKFLQGAFNNPMRYPRVLIAQSMVGREGLNLHEACRTVVMLHLEWNPGVAEQQIGRVDRVNSLWGKKLGEYVESSGSKAPQIIIKPVIFEGTYDENHWRVLNARWINLRAQLHGEIIPPSDRSASTQEELDALDFIDRAAPDFSPLLDQ